jgi:23S rRNA (guanosine2251-2'-O)-methyltransferase
MTDDQQTVLEGQIAIRAALQSSSRDLDVLYIDQTRRDKRGNLKQLARTAEAFGVRVEHVSPEVIAQYVTGQTHGGVIALAGPRRMVTLSDLLKDTKRPFIAMIDGVEDPFNFGQAIRALYAAGADGLVVRPRNWMSAAGTVARASAGASERIPTAIAETAEDAATFFRRQGLTIATTAKKRAVSLYDADLSVPLFVLIGGEKRGITRSFLEQADLILEIPYGRGFAESLGATAAASVVAFEIMRQRQKTAPPPRRKPRRNQ